MKAHEGTMVTICIVAAALLSGQAPVWAQQGANPGAQLQDLMKAMGQLNTANSNAAGVVSFRDLKALLPESLAGMKRTNAGGEKSTALGISMAYADATYDSEDGGQVKIKLSDMGGMGGMMAFAQAGWASTEIDRESDTGYERTQQFGAFKGKEKYESDSQYGEIEIMVGNRFMVEINGSKVKPEALQEAAKALDLQKLSELKPAAP